MTWIIGHRGAPRLAPENGLAGFRAALAAGADGVELDVHESADGRFLVHHDPATAAGPLGALTAAETDRGVAAHGATAVPRLEEALACLAESGPEPVVFVEVKALHRWSRLRRLLAPWRERLRLEIQSQDTALLAEAAADPGGQRLGLIATAVPGDAPAAWLRERGLASLSLQYHAVRPGTVAALQAAGMGCHLWTVNAPSAVAAAWRQAPDAVITDVPDRVRFYAGGA